MKGAGISQDEWLAALDDALAKSEKERIRVGEGTPGLSSSDIVNHTGCHINTARTQIRQLVLEGKWEMKGYRHQKRINGYAYAQPVYGPVEPKKRGKAK